MEHGPAKVLLKNEAYRMRKAGVSEPAISKGRRQLLSCPKGTDISDISLTTYN